MEAALLCNFGLEVVEGPLPEPKVSIIYHVKNGLMMKVKKKKTVNDEGEC